MKISMHTMAVDSFTPMLESLSALIAKGAIHASKHELDLANARLAPDMFTLAQQVQLSCYHATEGVVRLAGKPTTAVPQAPTTLDGMQQLIAHTVTAVSQGSPSDFDGAEERDCSIQIPHGGGVLAMNGLQFLSAWALPHFYFHVVTAYDILRHHGVSIGKQDYLSQVGKFRRAA
jgi:hypothetical protein